MLIKVVILSNYRKVDVSRFVPGIGVVKVGRVRGLEIFGLLL